MFLQSVFRSAWWGATAQTEGQQRTGPVSPQSGLASLSEDAALSVSAFFAGVRILVETVSGIPLYIEKKKGGQWVEDPDDELFTLLQLRPNPWMTHVDFWEAILFYLATRGNGYAYIARNELGMPVALYPLAAPQVATMVLADGSTWYIYTADGKQNGYSSDDVLHFRLFGNGRVGLSPLEYGAVSLGLANGADLYASRFFQRGGKPGGVLSMDKILTPAQRKEMRESFAEVQDGVDGAHRLLVLEAGMKYTQTQLSPESLQLLQARQFSVRDVGRFLNVPAFLLNEEAGTTSLGSGLEQQVLGFRSFTIKPYTTRISATLRSKLIPLADQRRKRVTYNYDELIAVDLKAKAEYYSKLVANGGITSNEMRTALGWPLSLDKYANALRVQGAMIPLELMGEKPGTSSAKLPALESDPGNITP